MELLTIGHSTHPIETFIEILRAHFVQQIVDVRAIPRSRHNPQFNNDALAKSLPKAVIGYLHMKELGGLRRPRSDSPNSGWRNSSFRGYADYMQTQEFETALTKLITVSRQERTAIMCAEAVPWRCHRSLIADALTVRGVQVRHIMSECSVQRHSLTSFAEVRDFQITYPPAVEPLFDAD